MKNTPTRNAVRLSLSRPSPPPAYKVGKDGIFGISDGLASDVG